jgi:hypothetical protein
VNTSSVKVVVCIHGTIAIRGADITWNDYRVPMDVYKRGRRLTPGEPQAVYDYVDQWMWLHENHLNKDLLSRQLEPIANPTEE